MRNFFNAADRLSLSFITLLSVLSLFFIPSAALRFRLLSTYAVLVLALIAVAWYRNTSRRQTAAFSCNVVFIWVLIFFLFNTVGDLTAGARLYDADLIKIDHALFGVHPTVWMERFISPWLTAVLQLAYISYYFIPVALGFVLVIKGKRSEFEIALFGIVLCFYLSYLGYLLVPAVGPRFTLREVQTAGLQAGPFITAIQETLNRLEHNKTDAFPSGHTAIALVTLFYAWKLREKILFRVLIPVVSALIVATVYLRYHYVIDVLAGIVLAVLTVVLAPVLLSLFSGRQPGKERHSAS